MFMEPSAAPIPTIPERLVFLLTFLCRVLAEQVRVGRYKVKLIELVTIRVSRIRGRITRLLQLHREGKLPKPAVRQRRARPLRPLRELPPHDPDGVFMPRDRGWAVKIGQYNAAAVRNWLEHLLTEPEMLALLEAVPQLKRQLRPICWALGVDLPACMVLPTRERAATARAEAAGAAVDPSDPSTTAARRPPRRLRAKPRRTPKPMHDRLVLIPMPLPQR